MDRVLCSCFSITWTADAEEGNPSELLRARITAGGSPQWLCLQVPGVLPVFLHPLLSVFGLFFSLLGPDPAPSDFSVFKPKNPTCLRERVYPTQLGSGTCPGGYWTTGDICVIWKRHHFSRQM